MSMDQAWVHNVENYFPSDAGQEKDASKAAALLAGLVSKFVEQKVDSMRLQKDEELERYRKEKESEKRFEAAKK
jgi:folylpolyglutamate synthase/dihydropteroate synthase